MYVCIGPSMKKILRKLNLLTSWIKKTVNFSQCVKCTSNRPQKRGQQVKQNLQAEKISPEVLENR